MIKLGVIGLTPGNGHPYSWPAIINGSFHSEEISQAGYPGISTYLTANRDLLGIDGAQVTHIWTHDAAISGHIAKAVAISNVVARPEEMIGQVDGVLLLRDDPEQVLALSRLFIDAGIPLFVDKPLATNAADLAYFSEQAARGKFIMSCSSMRYATECRAVKNELGALGPLVLATAVGKKDWIKYGVHMLEALFMLLDDPTPVAVQHVSKADKDIVYVEFSDGFRATLHLFMDISLTFQLSLFGKDGWRLIDVKNWYGMFRDNISEFIRSVREGKPRLAFEKTETIIRTLLAARESLEQGGRVIHLS
ncbi:Gfo/Idh/MocA family oxidoreductase [Larkinella knui]|uniref:Gfo/Idh/MocA family oxidoreductase n=1 Tax=Larkinella knui TaxID=2025310 RepID=A0A3P1CNI3_9BACT|nr:gfo/Idh/MocA family oxidoreductase [Larkinella knui]RRB14887.1 gfo/Idh/MocA family oxidoreductase [Larkinella knui]